VVNLSANYPTKEYFMSHRASTLFCASLVTLAVTAVCTASGVNAETKLSKDASSALTKRVMKFPIPLHVRAKAAGAPLGARPGIDLYYDLFIRYTQGTLYNPTTLTYDPVNLRAYQQTTDKSWDANVDGSAKFQAPAVVMKPGQSVHFKLYNQLPEQIAPGEAPPQVPSVVCQPHAFNSPASVGCFNATNLHSHGLWISPEGNSDNVLLTINPSVNFEYEYNVPVDHPAGTFWYHPHVHGTTAMQVGSGMAGTLVVYGERPPTASNNGDLDTLLKKFQPASGATGELMLFQQIPYACDITASGFNWDCSGNDAEGKPKVGAVENFKQVGPGSAWKNSGRYTSVNGQIQASFPMVSKQVYRWRLVDAGFQATIVFGIKKVNNVADLETLLTSKPGTIDPATVCNGIDVQQFEVAADGLTLNKIISKTQNYLQPGYRSDVLFSLPEDGYYCVYDYQGTDSLNGMLKRTSLLGVISAAKNPNPRVSEGSSISEQTAFLQAQLVAAATQAYPAGPVRDTVVADLNNNLMLSKFVPHPAITDAEIAQSNQTPIKIDFNFGADGNAFMINDVPYTGAVSHNLVLGTAQVWNLSSSSGSHPYHIHVNPFQVTKISNKDGTPVTDPQYKDLLNTWHDTIIVTDKVNIEIRTRYERWLGEFVLHCHILGHEDQGMMQNVKVVPPNSKGQASAGAHSH
jgi:FtsP/CotA-like multicopper oxidase with cupredoxin domain